MTPQQFVPFLVVLIPTLFVVIWLGIGLLLGLMTGWYRLMAAFPDRDEQPLLKLTWQSGAMGLGVNMNRVLKIGVCPSGLRLGMMRIFGPLCRDFLVPWQEIGLEHRKILFWPVVKLSFGNPVVGSLIVRASLAERLAAAAGDRWPERDPAPPQAREGVVTRR
ncbi:MAG TPA: hypothetical protein VMT54_11560 [Candidatus Cybelea sp.]|nr:hypothetical protein [Candidatus Cybelea sp.]